MMSMTFMATAVKFMMSFVSFVPPAAMTQIIPFASHVAIIPVRRVGISRIVITVVISIVWVIFAAVWVTVIAVPVRVTIVSVLCPGKAWNQNTHQ